MIRPPLNSGGYVAAPVKAWFFQDYVLYVEGVFPVHKSVLKGASINGIVNPMATVTIQLPKGCSGGIVAMRSVSDRHVIAHGRNLKTVLKKASKAGTTSPALMFVPNLSGRYV